MYIEHITYMTYIMYMYVYVCMDVCYIGYNTRASGGILRPSAWKGINLPNP